MENATALAKNYYTDVLASDGAKIWNNIKNTPEQTPPERWREKFEEMGRAYSLSGRYALIRLMDNFAAVDPKQPPLIRSRPRKPGERKLGVPPLKKQWRIRSADSAKKTRKLTSVL